MACAAKVEKFNWPDSHRFGAESLMRFSFGVKSAKVNTLAIMRNGRNPFGMPFMPMRSSKANPGICSIKRIFPRSRLSEVFPSIIQTISIDMIQECLWPRSGHPKPCQPMSHIRIPINADFDMIMFDGTSNLAFIPPSSSAGLELAKAWKPYKLARVWAIVKDRAEILRSNICLWSHPAQYNASMSNVKNAASGG